jgi:hypothetical protein
MIRVVFFSDQVPITPLVYAHIRLRGGCDGTIAWHICSANFHYPHLTNQEYPRIEEGCMI